MGWIMIDIKHLYTTKDVAEVRNLLKERQNNTDPITGLDIPNKQHVLDHNHKTQFVRAVLHRQSNVVLGKIENLWSRYLAWWYVGTLSDFLRGCADYLDFDHPEEYLHPSFIKKLQVEFNKLNETSKKSVLKQLGQEQGNNAKERKDLFKKSVLKKDKTFFEILEIIEKQHLTS